MLEVLLLELCKTCETASQNIKQDTNCYYWCVCVCVCVCVSVLSCVRLCETPRSVACRLLCSWNFPDRNTVMGCHFPSSTPHTPSHLTTVFHPFNNCIYWVPVCTRAGSFDGEMDMCAWRTCTSLHVWSLWISSIFVDKKIGDFKIRWPVLWCGRFRVPWSCCLGGQRRFLQPCNVEEDEICRWWKG